MYVSCCRKTLATVVYSKQDVLERRETEAAVEVDAVKEAE